MVGVGAEHDDPAALVQRPPDRGEEVVHGDELLAVLQVAGVEDEPAEPAPGSAAATHVATCCGDRSLGGRGSRPVPPSRIDPLERELRRSTYRLSGVGFGRPRFLTRTFPIGVPVRDW